MNKIKLLIFFVPLCAEHLGWIYPGIHLQGRFFLKSRENKGHAHGEADEGGRHDDLAQDSLLVPLAVVEPLDLQGGHVFEDQPRNKDIVTVSHLRQISPFAGDDSGLFLTRIAASSQHLLVSFPHWNLGVCEKKKI